MLRAMSQSYVDLVRSLYEEGALNSDASVMLGLGTERIDPEVEFVNPPDAIDSGTRRGVGGLRTAWTSQNDVFEAWSHELRDVFDAGDSVVASVVFRARGRGSAVDVEQDEVHTWTFRDGRLVRWEWGRDLARALETAGVR